MKKYPDILKKGMLMDAHDMFWFVSISIFLTFLTFNTISESLFKIRTEIQKIGVYRIQINKFLECIKFK